MPVQTTKTTNIYFPDGAKVSLKASGEADFTDVGAINGDITCTLNWDENQVETANAGKLAKQIKNMTIEGSLELINLEIDSLERFGGGLITVADTAASENSSIPNQIIAAGWDDDIKYELVMYESSSDSTKLKMTSVPVITSVTLDAAGTPEVLAAWGSANDTTYTIVADAGSYSGYSIIFNSADMTTVSPKTKAITIDYAANTPVAGQTIYVGSSTESLTAYAMRITHTDSNSKTRQLDLFSVDPNSGGFVFSFKGANSEGTESMPMAFTAKLDTSLTDGRQLMSFYVQNGAA